MKRIITAMAALLCATLVTAELKVSKNFRGVDGINRTRIRLVDHSLIVTDNGAGTNGTGNVTIHTFQDGLVNILGGVADLKLTFATEISNGAGIDLSVGSTANSNDDDLLDTDEANIIPAISVDPFTNTTSAVQGVLATAVLIDGTTTAKSAIINFIVDDADISSSVTGTVNGVVTILTAEIGDY